MDNNEREQSLSQQQSQNGQALKGRDKKAWKEPKLAFVEPKLTKAGDLKSLTGGFFGTFSP